MPFRPRVFQCGILNAALKEKRYFSTVGFSSSICYFMLFIHSAFFLWSLRSNILLKISVPLLHLVVGMSSPILPALAGRHLFVYFGTSCFVCIVWSYLGIFCLPPDLPPWVESFVLILLLFSARPNIFSCCSPVFVFLHAVVGFLSVFEL